FVYQYNIVLCLHGRLSSKQHYRRRLRPTRRRHNAKETPAYLPKLGTDFYY
ncbi:hypothetical protein B0H12DRAFT_1100553, partial [Mycena haematopus]